VKLKPYVRIKAVIWMINPVAGKPICKNKAVIWMINPVTGFLN
jgi:hypothetical protein